MQHHFRHDFHLCGRHFERRGGQSRAAALEDLLAENVHELSAPLRQEFPGVSAALILPGVSLLLPLMFFFSAPSTLCFHSSLRRSFCYLTLGNRNEEHLLLLLLLGLCVVAVSS